MPDFFAVYLDELPDGELEIVVPGIYESLVPWAEEQYGVSGDPRWRYRHDDGVGGVCHGGLQCDHGDAPPDSASSQGLLLAALRAGEPVEVSVWVARGHRWIGTGWSGAKFELPWGKDVRHVLVTADDVVSPVSR